jgi:hypothetical protein
MGMVVIYTCALLIHVHPRRTHSPFLCMPEYIAADVVRFRNRTGAMGKTMAKVQLWRRLARGP